jgi:hypothetical protein
MSKAVETLFNVALKHLSRDAKKAGAELPAEQLSHITAKQLKAVIEALGALAPSVTPPAEPEMRIQAPDGNFVVSVRGGKLHLVSWSSKFKGGEQSAAHIYGVVSGEAQREAARAEAAGNGPSWLSGKAGMAAMTIAIIVVNAFTIWFVTRPVKTLVPKYTLLPAGPAERLLTEVAGNYETGATPGDRRIEIAKDGNVQRYKFGPERTPTVKQEFTVQAADAQGKPALVTSRKALIKINDPLTVVLYGDTYRRVPR